MAVLECLLVLMPELWEHSTFLDFGCLCESREGYLGNNKPDSLNSQLPSDGINWLRLLSVLFAPFHQVFDVSDQT